MKRTTITFHAVLGMLTTTALLVAAGPPEFEIMRSTVDGGGVMRSTGDEFELSGTIGQPDAGVMVGDDFELTGGFWFAIPPGDCEDDGDVDLLDYKKFTTFPCLTGPLGGPPDAECRCFDVNRDGTVDLADFAVIQSTYTGPWARDQEPNRAGEDAVLRRSGATGSCSCGPRSRRHLNSRT